MNRRTFLLGAGTAGVTVTAGCLGFFDAGPTEPAESFIKALDDGEFDQAAQYLHSENPVGDVAAVADLIAGLYGVDDVIDALDITVEGSRAVEQSGDRASVEVTTSVDLVVEEPETDIPLEMRTDNGDWRVWTIDR
jgi:hypothetical protein